MESLLSDRKEKAREAKRKHYLRNLETERLKARLRAQRRREEETHEEASDRKEKHRVAQARYRKANRLRLATQAWQSRKDKKWKAARDADEAEYNRLMALE